MTDSSAPLHHSPSIAPDALVDAGTPLGFVCDQESSIRHFLSLILQGAGIDTEEFAAGSAVRARLGGKTPDIIFIDVALDAADAIETVTALGQCGYRGSVQLMSHRGSAVLERVRAIGEQNNLSMLPVLKKPLDATTIRKILQELKIGMPPPVAARIRLDEALENRWVEFWFQPKIDLRRKQLAGAEAMARVRHPQFGVLLPEAFMPGATEADLLRLSELAILSTVRAQRQFSTVGVHLRISIDIDAATLAKLPVGDILQSLRMNIDAWPGLIVDLAEEQIVTDIPLAVELDGRLSPFKVKLAIDGVGRGHAELAKAQSAPFVEFKLDEVFVVDCGIDKAKAPVCRTVIDLAHHHGGMAVGLGVEKAADILALLSMGCDYGQGFLLGQPMPDERFLSLLRQRTAGQRPARAGAA